MKENNVLGKILEKLVVIFLIIACLLSAYTVLAKYLWPGTVDMATQLSYYALVYVVFLGMGIAVQRNLTIRMDIISAKYPQSVQNKINVVCDVLIFACYALFAVISVQKFLEVIQTGEMNASAPIPLSVLYLAPALGFIISLICYIQKLIAAFKTTEKGENA